LSQDILFRS